MAPAPIDCIVPGVKRRGGFTSERRTRRRSDTSLCATVGLVRFAVIKSYTIPEVSTVGEIEESLKITLISEQLKSNFRKPVPSSMNSPRAF